MENRDFWWWFDITYPAEIEENVSSKMMLLDIVGAEVSVIEENKARMRIYFRSDLEMNEYLRLLNESIEDLDSIYISDKGIMQNQRWGKIWKDAFPPIEVGRRFCIMAPWHKYNSESGRMPIFIYPGSSFGTGYHESTQLVIEMLEEHLKKGDSMIDIGCGSGILSIVGLKLGASRALSVDNDPIVSEEVKRNALMNGIRENLIFRINDLASEIVDEFDLVTANILLKPILVLIPQLKNIMKYRNGRVIFGGITLKEEEILKENLDRFGFRILSSCCKGEWISVSAAYKA